MEIQPGPCDSSQIPFPAKRGVGVFLQPWNKTYSPVPETGQRGHSVRHRRFALDIKPGAIGRIAGATIQDKGDVVTTQEMDS